VDIRTSGKDLVANHLLFFLYHHVAVFPERLWPKAIAVNGFVSLEGKKMSKSKGPLLTLRQAVADNGADVTRLYILGNAEGTADVDWKNDGVEATRAHMERFYNFAREVIDDKSIDESAETTPIDRWMLTRLQSLINETTDAMEIIQTRRALQSAFYLFFNDVRRYQRRGGKNQLRRVLKDWVRLMAPFTPHICEEIWSELGEGYVSLAQWPIVSRIPIDEMAVHSETLLERTMSDIQEILKVTKVKPRKIILYTSPEWKRRTLLLTIEAKKSGILNMTSLMKEALNDPEIKKHTRDVPKYAQKIARSVQTIVGNALSLDEYQTLTSEKSYLEDTFGCPFEIYRADEPGADPNGKSKQAEPWRPAIYIE
jgi:leucyl-tRNA synthetase